MSIAEIETDQVDDLVAEVFGDKKSLLLNEFCRRKGITPQTGFRWTGVGLSGVQLGYVMDGRRRRIYREHYAEFIRERTAIARGEVEPKTPAAIDRAEEKRLAAIEADQLKRRA